MQIVEPMDIEDALRIDVGEVLKTCNLKPKAKCTASPAPDDLKAHTVTFTQLGGAEQSEVSHVYDVSVDVWASKPGDALKLANKVQGIIASLPARNFSSGRQYKTADARTPYQNPDPNRPRLPRCSFNASIGIRGESIF